MVPNASNRSALVHGVDILNIFFLSGLAKGIVPEALAEDALRSLAVREALAQLPERERRILELRFGIDGEPKSLEAIGAELGLTRERIRQLETQALARLTDDLGALAPEEEDELAIAA